MMAPPSSKTPVARNPAGRRWLRTLYYVFLAYPYGLVTLPLATFLVWYLLSGDDSLWAHLQQGSLREALHCGAVVAAIVVFAAMAVTYLILSIFSGWRESAGRDG